MLSLLHWNFFFALWPQETNLILCWSKTTRWLCIIEGDCGVSLQYFCYPFGLRFSQLPSERARLMMPCHAHSWMTVTMHAFLHTMHNKRFLLVLEIEYGTGSVIFFVFTLCWMYSLNLTCTITEILIFCVCWTFTYVFVLSCLIKYVLHCSTLISFCQFCLTPRRTYMQDKFKFYVHLANTMHGQIGRAIKC